MAEIKISKTIHPEKLKGAHLEDFELNSKIASSIGQKLSALRGESSKCWVCGSDKYDDAISVFGIEFAQCRECSHVYQKFIIPDKVIYDFFDKDKEINCHLPEEQFKYRTEHVSKPKVEELMRIRKQQGLDNSGGRWLDLGCGGGELLYQVINKYGWHGSGLDINEPGIEMAKKYGVDAHLKDIFGYYKEINPGKEPFDVISAIGYFDMVANPKNHLEIAKKLLKPGGMIMIDQPRFNSLTIDLIKILPQSALRYCNALQRSIFTDQSLKKFLNDQGFEVIFDWKYGLDFYTYISIVSMNIRKLAESHVHKFFIEHYNEFQEIIDRHNYNDCLFYIAQLK